MPIPVPIDKLHTMQHLLSPFAQSYCPDALRLLSAGRHHRMLVDRMIDCESHQVWQATVRRTPFSVCACEEIKDKIKKNETKLYQRRKQVTKSMETWIREKKIDIIVYVNEHLYINI